MMDPIDCTDCGCPALERANVMETWIACSGCCKKGPSRATFAEAVAAWNEAPCTASDFREFTGYAPTHCTICGSKWERGCKPPCINAPSTWGRLPTDEEADALCAADERTAEGR